MTTSCSTVKPTNPIQDFEMMANLLAHADLNFVGKAFGGQEEDETQSTADETAPSGSQEGLMSTTIRDYKSSDEVRAILAYDKTIPQTEYQAFGWNLPNLDKNTCDDFDVSKETKRLFNLKSYNVLDRHQVEDNEKNQVFMEALQPSFQAIVDQAKDLFDAPKAVISMVDAGRQYFISTFGLPGVTETPRSCAFCAHAIQQTDDDAILLVTDATKDIRFMNNPLVKDEDGLKLRFYVGATITSPEGTRLGTVCVLDSKPHDAPEAIKLRKLQDLAHQAMNEIMTAWLFDNM